MFYFLFLLSKCEIGIKENGTQLVFDIIKPKYVILNKIISNETIQNLTIPSEITHKNTKYQVSEINESALRHIDIKFISFPRTIREITNETFHNNKIIEIDLSKTQITTIPSFSFQYSNSLKIIHLPKTIQKFENFAFYKSRNLIKLKIPSSLEYIGEECFSFTALVSINLAKTKVKIIPKYAFNSSSAIRRLTLPENLVKICSFAFKGTQIHKLTIPHSVTTIEESAYEGMNFLNSFEFSKNIFKEIPFSCFKDCMSLTFISLPDTVEIIQAYAFFSSGLRSILLPKNLKFINISAFEYSTNLASIDFSQTKLETISRDGFAHCTSLSTITFCNSIKTLDKYCFTDIAVSDLIVPKSLTTIEAGVFKDCYNLFSADLSNLQIRIIQDELFMNCNLLRKIDFPLSITEISQSALLGTSITSFEGTEQLNEIGKKVFAFCTKLTTVNLSLCKITFIPKKLFFGCSHLSELHLGESIKTLESNFLAGSSLQQLKIPNSLRIISPKTFYNTKLTKINITKCPIFSIPMKEFEKSIDLKEVYLPKVLLFINQSAFRSCFSLEKIDFPTKLREIGPQAFRSCSSLISVNLSSQPLERLPELLFFNCTSLEELILPQNLKELCRDVFYGTDITGLVLPDSLSIVSQFSFRGMFSLMRIDLTNTSITTIYSTLFKECYSLIEIQLPTNLEILEPNAFSDSSELQNLYYCGSHDLSWVSAFSSKPHVYVTTNYPQKILGGVKVKRSRHCHKMIIFPTENNNKQTTEGTKTKKNKKWLYLVDSFRDKEDETILDGQQIKDPYENDEEESDDYHYFYDTDDMYAGMQQMQTPKPKESTEEEEGEDLSDKFITYIAIGFASIVGIFGIAACICQEAFSSRIGYGSVEISSSQSGSMSSSSSSFARRQARYSDLSSESSGIGEGKDIQRQNVLLK